MCAISHSQPGRKSRKRCIFLLLLTIFFSIFFILNAPLAATLVAIAAGFAFFLVAVALVLLAAIPVRPGDYIDASHGLMRIITFNNQFAWFARALNRVILNYLPYVDAARSTRLKNVLIDRGVRIPEGLVVGEDPELDAKRFRRTEQGICLITQSMIDRLSA